MNPQEEVSFGETNLIRNKIECKTISTLIVALVKFLHLSKFCVTANAISSFENRHFLSHRPPLKNKFKIGARSAEIFTYVLH